MLCAWLYSTWDGVCNLSLDYFTLVIPIPQRGGRKARTAKVLLRSATLDVLAPEGTSVVEETLRINVILAEEVDAPALPEPLHWVLLTTEAVNDAESALQVVRYYEMRWRIEDYHKVWKSGIGVERQRFQSVENLERMLVITAFLAVRLLQLRAQIDSPLNTPETTYAAILAEDEWKVLWLSTESNQPVPQTPPPAPWAFYVGRISQYQAYRACWLEHDLAGVVSLIRTTSRIPTQQVRAR
jgi:hypothetical protein